MVTEQNIIVSLSLSLSLSLQVAEAAFTEAIELHPLYWEAHLGLARLLATSSGGRRLGHGGSGRKRTDKVYI